MKSNTLAIALASLLVGGVAVAAFEHSRDTRADAATTAIPATAAAPATLANGDVRGDASIATSGHLDYADVVNVDTGDREAEAVRAGHRHRSGAGDLDRVHAA